MTRCVGEQRALALQLFLLTRVQRRGAHLADERLERLDARGAFAGVGADRRDALAELAPRGELRREVLAVGRQLPGAVEERRLLRGVQQRLVLALPVDLAERAAELAQLADADEAAVDLAAVLAGNRVPSGLVGSGLIGPTSNGSKPRLNRLSARDGTFTLVDAEDMPRSPSNQHGSAWGDYDNDGDLDLIVTAGNPGIWHNMLYRNNGDATFSWVTDNPIYSETSFNGFHGPSWGDYDNDGFLDLFIGGHASTNRLFHNDGNGSFTRITDHVAVNDPVTGISAGSWVDYDDDGDLDLFVSNVFVPPSAFPTGVLYRNDGDGVFTRVTDSGLSNRSEDTRGSLLG